MDSQRPYSIRTRIKTRAHSLVRSQGLVSQRPYSIRTRIKTVLPRHRRRMPRLVRDHIPLEQGLRRASSSASALLLPSQRPYSIRTRIKTRYLKAPDKGRLVRDHIPLEQGLRRRMGDSITSLYRSETIFH